MAEQPTGPDLEAAHIEYITGGDGGPSITSIDQGLNKIGFEDLGDDPEKHRWRAWWSRSDSVDTSGIHLVAYPVVEQTAKGAWISLDARRSGRVEWEEHQSFWMKKRLVMDGSGSAWAKPTQDEALKSLAIRLTRWARHVSRDTRKILTAASTLESLCPDLGFLSEAARKNIEGEM